MSAINCLRYPAPNGAAEVLLIMLPGAGIEASEFAEQGMVAAVQALEPAVAVTVAHPDIGLYLEDGVTEVLHRAVVEPALARGCTRIWLLGISLGGMGALLYASAHQAHVEGIVLLAPFLGTKGTVAELARAGGLASWSATGSAATIPEQRLLGWLQAQLAAPGSAPALYLGYAARDRFVPAHKMLAASLPPSRVAVASGGHDWPSWSALWRQLLSKSLFARHAGRCDER
jgi:pimeloyl-ACP methyl ester carboxylesterase